jgi:hypothetical protein
MIDDFQRLKNLQKMALRRACELHELTSERVHDEDGELELVYWLFIDGYLEPVEFDDMDEVEFDLKSRPVAKLSGAMLR